MDPFPADPTDTITRFPRPRGDGPTRGRVNSQPIGVSPPTRGWTRWSRTAVHGSSGFPAHAGMDPESPVTPGSLSRFPRPRGDGPVCACTSPRLIVVSPPTRGWTVRRRVGLAPGAGFPAHAGMDPRTPWAARGCRGFPRPRGDGPPRSWELRDSLGVSPPTRGWTSVIFDEAHAVEGFPAHAGMDHRHGHHAAEQGGFPRPRGDGPALIVNPAIAEWVSPPTRGWTPIFGSQECLPEGFPAHAGMDPLVGRQGTKATGFPRPRGDGPGYLGARQAVRQVSPPTRGWTHCAGC